MYTQDYTLEVEARWILDTLQAEQFLILSWVCIPAKTAKTLTSKLPNHAKFYTPRKFVCDFNSAHPNILQKTNNSKTHARTTANSGICAHVWKFPVCIPIRLLSPFDGLIICNLLWRFISFPKKTSSFVGLGDSFWQIKTSKKNPSKNFPAQQTYQTSMVIHVLMDVHDTILMVHDGSVGTTSSPSESAISRSPLF